MEHYTAQVTFCLAQAPERILDAPDIITDYYLNLVDWSNNNYLAVALGAHIYLWNAASGEIHQVIYQPCCDQRNPGSKAFFLSG